ncbi:MAG TPA: EF-P beta-lysylation protein EpmB [Nevskiaceae bacterium]|nr:EF-P beta-lysylation protein EpmB [Nevskiaceae bacterium]
MPPPFTQPVHDETLAAAITEPGTPRPATDRFVTSAAELLRLLELDPALPLLDYEHRRQFPLHVPLSFVHRMRHRDPHDPLFVQVWPAAAEAVEAVGFSRDAVGELDQRQPGGVIRKYQGRALVITTGACAVNCRYCFRRHFPYAESAADGHDWQTTLEVLAADTSLSEVILSGGDPLSLTDTKLASLAHGLDAIGHLKRLRIHSRLPIVQPGRINASLLDWLGTGHLQRIMVVHANHANEIDDAVASACGKLHDAGVMLLNQSVLLRGVNDQADALVALSERLCEVGVLPYYLHLLDRVQGAAHFEVPEARATALMRDIVKRLPGYLVPRLVREVPGVPAKTRIRWSV